MTTGERAVAVKQLPEISSAKQGRMFLREIQGCMNVERPRIVLDCSNVRQLDKLVIQVLLCCLEEAMKRNGDIKLAALPAGAGVVLAANGVNRLFDIHDTTADAVDSFHLVPTGVVAVRPMHGMESDRREVPPDSGE